ncbi:MAG: peptide chain release factor N(5)-glutamine methyltransferase [Pseudomonadota bacterium]|jgi:release factor glutamine methyltransferase
MAHTVASLLKSSDLPAMEAQMLLEHVTGWNRTALISYPERNVEAKQALLAQSLFARRRFGEPVAYLTGLREFYGLMFEVSPAVLIPRPETELLVDLTLARLKKNPAHSVLDLGTGSGAVAVTLAKLFDTAQVTGVEKSKAALNMARKNAETIIPRAFNNTLQLILGDWYQPVGKAKFNIIVANPPYIAEADAHLAQGDLRHEPIQALTSGSDGLDAIRKIISGAPKHLHRGGWLLIEHGYDQEKACADLLKHAGFNPIFCEKDLAGIPRVSGGQLK